MVDQGIVEDVFGDLGDKEFNELVIGEAGDKKVDPTYTTDTMTYNGETYTSTWQKEDYAIIQPVEHRNLIVGTHRYGTRAGTMYYKNEKPDEATIIHWKDQNNDQEVQWNEITKLE